MLRLSSSLIKTVLRPSIIIPLFKINRFTFANDTNIDGKTSRQIEREIIRQKFKDLQNTYKALSTTFGLIKPTPQELQKAGKNYPKPKTVDYDLKTLRQCSKEFPIYLYYEFKNKSSPFHIVVDKVLDSLWKAEKKETLETLEFLYEWRYKGVDILQMYASFVERSTDMDCFDYFTLLRKFYKTQEQKKLETDPYETVNKEQKLKNLVQAIQIKLLQKIREFNLGQEQYGPLIKLINLFNISNLLSEEFYFAVTDGISKNINSVPPKDALNAYVFFTYNQADTPTPFQLQKIKMIKKEQASTEQLVTKLLQIIENRVFSQQCLKFMNSEEIIAVSHTFLKNSILKGIDSSLSDENPDKVYFNSVIDKIISRIELMWVSEDFKTHDKKMLLKLSKSFDLLRRQKIIALFHQRFLNQVDKFEKQLLTQLYLASYEANMLTPETARKLQNKIVQELFNLDREDVSRAAWLLVITEAPNMQSYYKKIEDIVLGGLANKGYDVKQVTVIVWALGSNQVTEKMVMNKKMDQKKYVDFWNHVEQFLFTELTQKYESFLKDKVEAHEIISECSWILWGYLNNQELSLKTIDLISQIIIELITPGFSSKLLNLEFSPFELTNITSFYYSIDHPVEFEPIIKQVKVICYEQFIKIYRFMECAEICRVLKYISHDIWKNEEVSSGLIQLFDAQCDDMNYNDVLNTLGLLLRIQKNQKQRLGSKLRKLIVKLNERRLRMMSVEASRETVKSQ